ncbi:MAG TPA: peptidoglycan-associated lipoprotein Pal [Thermoanaerobaculia bacterium]|nr:peptidoglycan-associated lipoprotein Pal [Thermoanaerobaculia bacterium]
MMKKTSLRLFLLSLAMVAVILAAGCRSKTKPVPVPAPEPVPIEVTETAPPPVATIEQPDDFGPPAEPMVEAVDLSGTIDQVNERVQRLGYIRDVFFEYDSASLSADAQDALAVTASWLKTHPEFNVMIEGHTDERGTQQYNLALGDRRANIARDYLLTLGIPSNRVRTISYGEERPFAVGSNESAWSQNRRAHIVLMR